VTETSQKEKRRSRSRSPRRHRSRSPKRRNREKHGTYESSRHRSPRGNRNDNEATRALNAQDRGRNDEDETAMMEMMGFATFNSTKGKRVEGQMEGTSRIQKPKKYRQYMNRRGGFNRPLDYVM